MQRLMKVCLSLLFTLAVLCGCATAPRGAAESKPGMGTCTVCRYNNDLACVEFAQGRIPGKDLLLLQQDLRSRLQQEPREIRPRVLVRDGAVRNLASGLPACRACECMSPFLLFSRRSFADALPPLTPNRSPKRLPRQTARLITSMGRFNSPGSRMDLISLVTTRW